MQFKRETRQLISWNELVWPELSLSLTQTRCWHFSFAEERKDLYLAKFSLVIERAEFYRPSRARALKIVTSLSVSLSVQTVYAKLLLNNRPGLGLLSALFCNNPTFGPRLLLTQQSPRSISKIILMNFRAHNFEEQRCSKEKVNSTQSSKNFRLGPMSQWAWAHLIPALVHLSKQRPPINFLECKIRLSCWDQDREDGNGNKTTLRESSRWRKKASKF